MFRKLRGRIREVFGTQAAFAAAMKMSEATLSKKLQGITEWNRAEIEKTCQLLDVPLADAPDYFF